VFVTLAVFQTASISSLYRNPGETKLSDVDATTKVKPLMFTCSLLRIFHKLNKTAKFKIKMHKYLYYTSFNWYYSHVGTVV